jgi:hypothetical protein
MTKMRHNYFNSEKELSEADRNFVLSQHQLASFPGCLSISSMFALSMR